MKPILFSTPMVQAILAGRKTQTRRVAKSIDNYISCECNVGFSGNTLSEFYCDRCCQPLVKGLVYDGEFLRPSYQPGDVLWVRETWDCMPPDLGSNLWDIVYAADGFKAYVEMPESFDPMLYSPSQWRPSIHMPRAAARIFLRVTDVRVERVQDISEEDAVAEGCQGIPCVAFHSALEQCVDCASTGWVSGFDPIAEYLQLWDSLNFKRGYGWEKNPWVWVYTFARITKEEAEQPQDSDTHSNPRCKNAEA